MVQAPYRWTISKAANTITDQTLFMLAAQGLISLALAGLFLSRGRISREETV